jgi:parvulin-like peptidyl-prolyl isomerase
MHSTRIAPAGIVLFLSLITGCGSNKHLPTTLKPQSFVPTANAAPNQSNGAGANQTAKTQNTLTTDDAQLSASIPPAPPSTRPVVGASSGTFMYIGTVVAEVNGQPIYADKILAKVDTELSVKAPLLEPEEFRAAATNAILKQILYDKRLELRFAAAQRNCTEEEQQRAAALAAMWRQKEITKAGGSPAVARRISIDRDGIDFEERVKEKYQEYMILIWQQGKLLPRVQVSGDDMRRYYDQNVAEMFTDKAGVRFRAIKIGVKEMGNREYALDEAQRILERARRGEDFAKLSDEKNHDPIRSKNQGWWLMEEVKGDDGQTIGTQPRWVERGSLRLEQIEKAAFAMQVGEVSSVPIDVGDGFYILKLEAKQNGRVRPFEEPDVQEEIYRRLKGAQLLALFEKQDARLLKESVVREDRQNVQKTIDMAMQKYFAWSRANGLTRANPHPAGGAAR